MLRTLSTSLALLVTLAVWGCGVGDATLDEVDPESAPAKPTWSGHVEVLMQTYCTACHSPEAQWGGDELSYETCEDTRRHWGDLRETVIDTSSMPPGGAARMRSWEVLTLERWWAQGGTCD